MTGLGSIPAMNEIIEQMKDLQRRMGTLMDALTEADPYAELKAAYRTAKSQRGSIRPTVPAPAVPWDCPEDVPLNCWFRHKDAATTIYQPICIESIGVQLTYRKDHWEMNWKTLAEYYEHSTDRRTWLPCTKPSTAQQTE